MKRGMQKGSYTIEASIWVASIVFMIMFVLRVGIYFYEESKNRERSVYIEEIDILEEFYMYQIFKELGEDWLNDESGSDL